MSGSQERVTQTLRWFNADTHEYAHNWSTGQPYRILGRNGHRVMVHAQWSNEFIWREDDGSIVPCDDPEHPHGLVVKGERHTPFIPHRNLDPVAQIGGMDEETYWTNGI